MGVTGIRLSDKSHQNAGSTPATSKVCLSCEKELPITDFYSNGRRNGEVRYKPRCKKCEMDKTRNDYWDIIEEHFEGWRCNRCGFWGHPLQMDCHHIDPSKKTRDISNLRGYSAKKLRSELEKCELLCANCHRLE